MLRKMMTGEIPYYRLGSISIVKEQMVEGVTPEPHPPPENWPDGLLELVRMCWSQSPENRPSVRSCVESVHITLSLIERRPEAENQLSAGIPFIARDRLHSGPKHKLHEAGNRTTRQAKLSPPGALVVVKEISLREIHSVSSRTDIFKHFARQMAALSSLNRENILELVGYSATYDFETVALVTPYMANGNLANYMDTEVDMRGKLGLARDTMNGLRYLHAVEPPVVHGYITPSNVLINDAGKAVLGDVGLTAMDLHPVASLRASVRWSSPEVNLGESAAIQSDIWSWACVFLKLVTGDRPYSSIQSDDQIKLVMYVGKRGLLTPDAFHELDDVPDAVMRLLRRCWEFTPSRRPNAGECMDILNTILETDPNTLTGTAMQSPDDDISRFIDSVSPQAICINGRFGDVFKGTHKIIGEVALKRLRIGGAALDEQVIRRFEREADTWRRLDHPHVLKFLGTYKPEGHLYFVSPFMQNGTLLEYVSDRPDINRVKLLCETSDAIGYLHRESIVHGDIKAGNLLISNDGHVLLCDFGLTKSTYSQTSTALKGAGTLRWQSPELWNNEPRTFGSDVYAFAMTIVEVLTGLPPFSHLENEIAVMMAVYQRDERPAKSPMESNGLSYENAWRVAEACWPKIPGERISMSEAFRLLKTDPSLA